MLVLVGGFLGARGIGAWKRGAVEDAAREAATAYADLVATGDEGDLEQLWAMSLVDDQVALRTAGELLVASDERIEVVRIGEPQETEESGVGGFRQLRRVAVTYRLGGAEREGEVVLGLLEGRSGRAADDWRVVRPLTGALGWNVWDPRTTTHDLYLNGVLHGGDPVRVNSGEAPDQPLYPAVYRFEARNEPWYASPAQDVTVHAGVPAVLVLPVLHATEATRREAQEQLVASFASCGTDASFTRCPAFDLADRRGADVFGRGWWRGLAKKPTMTFDGQRFTLSGGVLRIVVAGRVQRVRFGGWGAVPVDLRSGQVHLSTLTIEEEW